jgi:CheY-like chemotaxis protein
MRIFVLDDEATRFESISRQFAGSGREFVWAATANDVISILEADAVFDVMFFDHDLGMSEIDEASGLPPLSGLDVARYVIRHLDPSKWPDQVFVHSQNPVGAKAIQETFRDVGIAAVRVPFSESMAA